MPDVSTVAEAAAAAQGLTWLDIGKIAAASTVVSAIVTAAIGALREHNKEKRGATYLALRIAVALEQFAISCADQIGENDVHEESHGHAGTAYVGLPKNPEYPTDADWKALIGTLAARALGLTNEIHMGARALAFSLDNDPENATSDCSDRCAVLGLRALTLATELRSEYRIRRFDPREAGWDIQQVLMRRHERVQRHEALAREADRADVNPSA